MHNYYEVRMEWDSFQALFNRMDAAQNYVVIRNYEDFYDSLLNNSNGDIDILCENRQEFADAVGAARLNRHTYNYMIMVNGKKIFLDLRSPGDGYFCQEWELAMLKNRKKHSLGFYIVDDENYFYSLMYHVLFHKEQVTPTYHNKLQTMWESLKPLDAWPENMAEALAIFMSCKGYKYTLCSDCIPSLEEQLARRYTGGGIELFYPSAEVMRFFQSLHENNIDYVLIKNINGELPHCLKRGKDIDILVHSDCWARYFHLMSQIGFSEIIHPHGKEQGWKFLYGMDSCHQFEHQKNGIQIDAYLQLATKSIDMDAWLPLDKSIQKSIWLDRVWNDQHGWWQMDDKNLLVYLVTRSIFEKEIFTEEYICEIERLKYLLKDAGDELEAKFYSIVYRFAPKLMKMLHDGDYRYIRESYLTFSDY